MGGGGGGGWWVASYPLLSQAPTPVEVEVEVRLSWAVTIANRFYLEVCQSFLYSVIWLKTCNCIVFTF